MHYITKHQVRKLGRRIRADYSGELGPLDHSFLTAVTVLDMSFGELWTKWGSFGTKPQEFLLPRLSSREVDYFESRMRVIQAAEGVLNLQADPGFALVKDDLLRKSMEAEMAPINLAKLLRLNGHPSAFVKVSEIQGETSCDLTIDYHGTIVACEVKCKLGKTPMSTNTVSVSLKAGAQQLPRAGSPGIIVLALPQSWTRDDAWILVLEHATRQFFQGVENTHVSAIFVLSYQRFPVNETRSATLWFTKEFMHPAPAIAQGDLRTLFKSNLTTTSYAPCWTTIPELLGYSAI